LNGETSKNSIYTGRKKIDIQGLFSQVIFIALKGAKRNLQSARAPCIQRVLQFKVFGKSTFKIREAKKVMFLFSVLVDGIWNYLVFD
jgi:hypothetical protein